MVSLVSNDRLLSATRKLQIWSIIPLVAKFCDEWNEVSASYSFSRLHLTEHIGATPVVHNVTHTVQPTQTLHKSTAIHLISSIASFLDTPFGMAVRSPPHNDSIKGECHIAQHQTECMLKLNERGEMKKTGNSYYSFGDWASQNQHVNTGENRQQRQQDLPFWRLHIM